MPRRWILLACGLASLVVALLASMAVARLLPQPRPATPSRTTDTHSAALADDTAKRAFLEQYLTFKSAVEATEFHIVYHDNSAGSIPGPSDWDMQVVLKVAPADVPRWTAGMKVVSGDVPDLAWSDGLVPDEPRWQTSTQSQVYIASGKLVAAYARDGIVVLRLQTSP